MVELPSPGEQVMIKIDDTSGLRARQVFPAGHGGAALGVVEDGIKLRVVSD